MNAMNLMEAISDRSEEKVAQDLFRNAQAKNSDALPETAGFIPDETEKTEERQPFRIAHHIMFAASAAAVLAMVGGFAYLMHSLANKPDHITPGASVIESGTENIATNAISTGVIEITTTVASAGQNDCPTVPAESVAECREIRFPETIDGKAVSIVGMTDEDTVLVYLNDSHFETNSRLGTVSLTDMQYTELLELSEGMFPQSWNDSWVVMSCAETANDWVTRSRNSYRLLDLHTKELGPVFWEMSQDENGGLVGGGSYDAPVFSGNTLYFDDYSMADSKMTSTIYAYDIAGGRITASYPECHAPMIYQGELIAFTWEGTWTRTKLISAADQGASFSLEVGEETDGSRRIILPGPDGIYQLESDLVNLTTGQKIMKTPFPVGKLAFGETAGVLSGQSTAETNRPAVYDFRNNQVLTFENVLDIPDAPEFWEFTAGNHVLMQIRDADRTVNRYLLVTMPQADR